MNTPTSTHPEAAPSEREKRAPVQGYVQGIPWSLHLEAYNAYCKKWSPQPALIEGWCRGGFSVGELDEFIPGWRDKVSEIGRLRKENAELRAALSAPSPAAPVVPQWQEQAALYRAIRAYYLEHHEHPTGRFGTPQPNGGELWTAAATDDQYDNAMRHQFPLAAAPSQSTQQGEEA